MAQDNRDDRPCKRCGAPMYTAEATGERACSDPECIPWVKMYILGDWPAGESNCSCDQRGRNVSCERCRP